MGQTPLPSYKFADNTLVFTGTWCTKFLHANILDVNSRFIHANQIFTLDLSNITELDTNGACLIQRFIKQLEARHIECKITKLSEEHERLMQLAAKGDQQPDTLPQESISGLASIGMAAIYLKGQALQFTAFLGQVSEATWFWMQNPKRIRWTAIFHCVDATGYQAMGIVALLSFLIGVVLCYQMGVQLESYGASIYVVDLLGISILREFAPLLTAIIVAGRTGSAFAAQIGTMKLNQEIDALNTMGVSSTELLVMPKIFGLVIALPLLSVLSMAAGVFGGMIMAKVLFSITYLDFLSRFGSVIAVKTLFLGIIKTPVFAVLIASVGCFQGLQVSNSAESVGKHTTISVVHGIFLIIVTDAFFSILYSKLGL